MLTTGIYQWLFLLLSLSTWVTISNSKEMRVVCYYTNWSVYRPGEGKFSPQNINPYLCTHLIYAFGGFTKENTLKPFDKYQDIEKGGYAKFTGLKTYNKNLKTMLAIGGWNEGSSRFSPMVANPERRKEFAKNAIKFLRLNHFDGLDLDWEYPSFRDGGKPRDKDNYSLLVKELREEFDREAEKTGRPRLLLTMAVPAGIEYINKGFDVPKLTKYLDWMNILSYDFHSAFEPAVNHHAPLYPLEEESEYNFESDLNIDYAIKHYLKSGAEPSKLVLGIPTYGRSYTLYNPDAFEIGSPADGPGTMGEATRENGYLAYYEICDYVKNQDWEVEQPNDKAMGPYAFKDNQWVGYDDEEIVKKKAQYVVENGLGGIMFWSIDNDDFRGNCHGKPYPLIEAGRAALIEAYGITDDNSVLPPSKPIKSRSRTRTKTANKIEEPENKKSEKPVSSRRRTRIRENKEKEDDEEVKPKRKNRRKNVKKEEETSSYSSLKIVTPSYTTPAPPATPEMDGGFKCEDEGFYPHPKDCKKYFWCLNGAGDTGIIAHQFTCPAGLYFNKAADSCDYTQNVLCKKSAQKTTTKKPQTTSTSTTTTTTTRVPPKIAATSRSTIIKQTTTTEAYEDEEYDDDEDNDNEERKNSEEDPKVIKELIELIRKAGGIEELEKQFHIKGNHTDQATTKSPIFSKSLYERVLNKAIKNTPANKNTSFRNSRGPQSLNTEKDEKETKTERGKLQYTSISRLRSSASRDKKIDEEKDDQDKEQDTETQSRKVSDNKYPSYTNIRRVRVSTTTNEPETNRNKILGEADEDEDDDEDDDDTDDESEDNDFILTTKRPLFSPQYVNIRRQRPTTTEESSTSKYTEIRRGSTTESSTEDNHTTSKYKILRRGTTTTTSSPEINNTESQSTSSTTAETTTPSTIDITSRSTTPGIADNTTNEETTKNEYIPNVITTTGTYVTTTDEINFIKSESNQTKPTETPNISSRPNFINHFRKRPQLFEPRPFTKPTEASTSRSRTTQTTKVSESDLNKSESENNKINKEKTNVHFRSRGSSRFSPNRNLNTATIDEDKKLNSTRRRVIATEKIVDENRTYRPSEIADLSSLTAADIDIRKNQYSRTNFRKRRPLRNGSISTTEKGDLQNEGNSPKRRRIHVENSNPIIETSNPVNRSRKIIRRFRTSTAPPLEENIKNDTLIPYVPLKNNEVDDDEDTTTEEEENIKLSESNIRENSDINSFNSDSKLKNKFKSEDTYGKSSVFEKNVNREYETTLSTTTSTPSTILTNRTRKIIRKLLPTQPTKIAEKEIDTEQIFGRKRKIIRKLRPISTTSLPPSEIPDHSESIEEEKAIPVAPKRVFRPKLGNRRFTSTTSGDIIEANTPENLPQRNKTILVRGPSRLYRPRSSTTTTEPSVKIKFSPKYKYITRSSSTTEYTRFEPENPSTTEESATKENFITTYIPDEILTTDKLFTDATTTDFTSDDNDNTPEISTNTNYEETSTSNSESTTSRLNKDYDPTTVTEESDTTTDYATELFTTTIGEEIGDTSTIAKDTASSVQYRSTLKPVNSRPKLNFSRLTNKNVLQPEVTTKKDNRFNKYRQGFRTSENTPNIETSSPISINKSLYKLKRPKPIDAQTEQEGTEIEKSNKFKKGYRTTENNIIDAESSSIAPINRTLYNKYRKPIDAQNEQEGTGNEKSNEESHNTENDIIDPESSSIAPINRTLLYNKYRKPIDAQNEQEGTKNETSNEESRTTENDIIDPESSSIAPINRTLLYNKYRKPIDAQNEQDGTENEKSNEESQTTENDIIDPEYSSIAPNNKTLLYNKYRKPIDTQNEQEDTENEKSNEESRTIKNNIIDPESSSIAPNNKTLFYNKFRKPIYAQNEQEVTENEKSNEESRTTKNNIINPESSSTAPINKTFLYNKLRKPIDAQNEQEDTKNEKSNKFKQGFRTTETNIIDPESSSTAPINKTLYNRYRKPIDAQNEQESIENKKSNKFKQGFRTTENNIVDPESSSTAPINRTLYNKYRKSKPQSTEKGEEDINEEKSDIPKSSSLPINKELYKIRKPSLKENTTEDETKSRFIRPTKITTTTKEPDELKDINTDAIKNRNKSIFNNRNKLIQLTSSVSPPTEELTSSTTPSIEDFTTTIEETTPINTEHPTTLVHVFSEKVGSTSEPTDVINQTTTSKVERLIEVNRIINVKTKEDIIKNHHLEHVPDRESSPFYDKIGAINRVTVIKVVDKDGQLINNNETSLFPVYTADSQTTESPIKSSVDMIIQIAKIEEIPAPNRTINLTNINVQIKDQVREERKFDFISSGKVDDSKVRNVGKAEIIDGISHINIITPRPIQITESSTIALEGLFQTDKPTLFTSKNSINDELLETENSKFVNVRILQPDEDVQLNNNFDEPKVIPIKLLKQDDDFIMRARVVEVAPKTPFNTIKIVPIRVETKQTKKTPPPLPLIRINRQYN